MLNAVLTGVGVLMILWSLILLFREILFQRDIWRPVDETEIEELRKIIKTKNGATMLKIKCPECEADIETLRYSFDTVKLMSNSGYTFFESLDCPHCHECIGIKVSPLIKIEPCKISFNSAGED